MKYSVSALALLNLVSAHKLKNRGDPPPIIWFNQPSLISPQTYHWNEDPHSVPDPMEGKHYVTSTQAKYMKHESTDLASEPVGINFDFFSPYNVGAPEPHLNHYQHLSDNLDFVQLKVKNGSVERENDSESDSDSDDTTVLW